MSVHYVGTEKEVKGKEYRKRVRGYQKQLLGLASRAIYQHDPEIRQISSTAILLSAKSFSLIKRKIQRVHEQIMEIAKKDFPGQTGKVDRVYQINYQLFPVSRLEEARKGPAIKKRGR